MHRSGKSWATLVYILQALGLFSLITWLVAIIINYLKRDDIQDRLTQSHFRWQIRTFWADVIWTVIGVLTIPLFFLGYIILIMLWCWTAYRVIRGWLRLTDELPMYI